MILFCWFSPNIPFNVYQDILMAQESYQEDLLQLNSAVIESTIRNKVRALNSSPSLFSYVIQTYKSRTWTFNIVTKRFLLYHNFTWTIANWGTKLYRWTCPTMVPVHTTYESFTLVGHLAWLDFRGRGMLEVIYGVERGNTELLLEAWN